MNELEFAKKIARIAGDMMLEAKNKTYDVSLKSKNDYVSEIDLAIEKRLQSEILKQYPEDEILGEEYGTEGKNPRRWIVDPIDGTTNFVHQIPFYCVSIAFEIAGVLKVGVIYAPENDEMFYASRNEGAFLNGVKLSVSTKNTLESTIVATGFVTNKQSISLSSNLALFNSLASKTRGIRRLGSAALDLAYVAAGRLDGFWEFDLSPWDIAAGIVIVEEAGGQISQINGKSHHLLSDSILATNFVIWKDFVDALNMVDINNGTVERESLAEKN